jgi:hypothetical protein
MDTALIVAILSVVALVAAALGGGGLALGIMRLLGRGPANAGASNGDSASA